MKGVGGGGVNARPQQNNHRRETRTTDHGTLLTSWRRSRASVGVKMDETDTFTVTIEKRFCLFFNFPKTIMQARTRLQHHGPSRETRTKAATAAGHLHTSKGHNQPPRQGSVKACRGRGRKPQLLIATPSKTIAHTKQGPVTTPLALPSAALPEKDETPRAGSASSTPCSAFPVL